MSEFIMTPSNIDFLESVFRSPITGNWTIHILTFNTNIASPYYNEVDPLNEDPQYQKSVIDHFYVRLTEKWLYKEPIFRSLLKYFNVEKEGDEGKVSLITDVDKVSNEKLNKQYSKYVFKYIEKYFITKRLISKILNEYVKTTHIKWYDLFHNTDLLKDYLAYRLKKLIVSTIYELQDRKKQTGE